MLLTENRKRKIRMRLRQILVLAHTVAKAHAEDPARADRRERLHHLIACIARIRPRIVPDLKALHAVGLQHPDGKCREHRRRHDPQPATRRNEKDECHQKRHAEHNAGRSEVRLAIDEERHHENRTKRHKDASTVSIDAEMFLAEHRRDRERSHQHRHQLCELCRLKAERPDRKPALCAVYRGPHKENGNEQKDGNTHAHKHQSAHTLIVHVTAKPTRDQSEKNPHQMPLQKIIGILEIHRRKYIARAKDIDRPRHEKDRHDDSNRLCLALKEGIARAHHALLGRRATSRPIFAPRALNLRSYSVIMLSSSPSA